MKTYRSLRRSLLATLVLTAAGSAPAPAATLTVTNAADDFSAGSLRLLVSEARDGDIITFDPRLNGAHLLLHGELEIDRSVTILGPGPANLAVSGGGSNRVFNIQTNGNRTVAVVVAGLTITGGRGRNLPFLEDRSEAGDGGAIRNDDRLTLSNCVLNGNMTLLSFQGGAIYNRGRLTLLDSLVHGNRSAGGAIASDLGTLAITNTVILNNQGAGVRNGTGTVALSQCVIQGNTDGGFCNDRGTGVVVNCLFTGNSAPAGGALYNRSGILSVQYSTLDGNSADDGGAIYSSLSSLDGIPNVLPALTVQHSTFSGNLAANEGGAVYSSATSEVTNITLQHCTFSGNVAWQGGAIYQRSGNLTLLHGTFNGNLAYSIDWEGLENSATLLGNGPLTIGHTLFAGNFSSFIFDRNHADPIRNLGYNLFDDLSFDRFGISQPDDVVTPDARLGPLADNGGPTLTHALLPGSPAIDAGFGGFIMGVTNDQRGPGFPRRVGSAVDIGAFEYAASTAPPRFVLAEKVPAGLRLNVQGLPNELLRIETNAVPGPAGWKTFVSRAADGSGRLSITNTGVGTVPQRFYRAVRP